MMIRKIALLIGFLYASECYAQVNYEVKIMSWNVLNWPSNSNLVNDTTFRCPAYRTVINYAQPDVLVTMENTSVNSPVWFLDQVMNTGIYHYAKGTYINGYDTDNAIYFRDSLFDFISNLPIQTSLRDINQFTLVFKATGDTLHIFSCHLKASQGYETQRAAEVDSLRKVTNAFPPGTNFLIGGDFNIYYSGEPAYVKLLQDNAGNDGNFLDALHLTGTWNNPAYAPYHTQSTRVSSSTGGSGGGMNDRFDMILYSNGVAQPPGVYYMPGTYKNIGNDGNHYNHDINYGTNTSVPPVVADALYDASDHLPVMLTLMIGPTSGINETKNIFSDVTIFPEPVCDDSKIRFTLKEKCNVQFYFTDAIGRLIDNYQSDIYEPGEHFLPVDWKNLKNSGFYFLSIKFDNTLISKKIVIIR